MTHYTKLDSPDVLPHLFLDKKEERTPLLEGWCDFDCTVEENTVLGCRFYGVDKDAPTIIYFHGKKESVSGYDSIAPEFNKQGLNLLVTTYRGYGWSTGTATASSMLSDGDIIFQKSLAWLEEKGFNNTVFIMGRSLGSAVAIEAVTHHLESVKGLIIESGFADTLPLLKTLGVDLEKTDITEEEGFNNIEKIEEITIPTLILHGSADSVIPVKMAEKLQAHCGARGKRFMVIPGADHGTMIETGGIHYFTTIKSFIDTSCGVTNWGYKRRKSYEK